MRLTTGVAGDGDPIGITLRAASMAAGKGHGSRKTGVSVHVVPLESWWAGTWETLCSRMVVEFVGWHDPDAPDPRLCSVCTRRVAQLRADRLEAVA